MFQIEAYCETLSRSKKNTPKKRSTRSKRCWMNRSTVGIFARAKMRDVGGHHAGHQDTVSGNRKTCRTLKTFTKPPLSCTMIGRTMVRTAIIAFTHQTTARSPAIVAQE